MHYISNTDNIIRSRSLSLLLVSNLKCENEPCCFDGGNVGEASRPSSLQLLSSIRIGIASPLSVKWDHVFHQAGPKHPSCHTLTMHFSERPSALGCPLLPQRCETIRKVSKLRRPASIYGRAWPQFNMLTPLPSKVQHSDV